MGGKLLQLSSVTGICTTFFKIQHHGTLVNSFSCENKFVISDKLFSPVYYHLLTT